MKRKSKQFLSLFTAGFLLLSGISAESFWCTKTVYAEDVIAEKISLKELRKVLKEEKKTVGIAYLGGVFDSDTPHLLEDYKEIYSFVGKINKQHTIKHDGYEAYCIFPRLKDSTITVYEYNWVEDEENGFVFDKGEILYKSSDGNPIILYCNVSDIMSNTLITIENETGFYEYSPFLSLEDGEVAVTDWMYDFSIYPSYDSYDSYDSYTSYESYDAYDSYDSYEEIAEIDEIIDPTDIDEEYTSSNLIFHDLTPYEFYFSSGAGGWGTTLTINMDGTFEGYYSDSELGATGEAYPNGTVYKCSFHGCFENPVKMNDYTYSMDFMDLSYDNEVGTSEIIDGVLYEYTEPYGLENTEHILVYVPGVPLNVLPQGYLDWYNYYSTTDSTTETLACFGLYNEAEQTGFTSYLLTEEPSSLVNLAETKSNTISAYLDTGLLDQATMNRLSQEHYFVWDDVLNQLWGILKNTLDASQMASLTQEELEWIAMKESESAAAGKEFAGGSMETFLINSCAAKLTKQRVYELLDIYYSAI